MAAVARAVTLVLFMGAAELPGLRVLAAMAVKAAQAVTVVCLSIIKAVEKC